MNNPFQDTGGARGVRALMWGAAGVGKTWLACQFPRPIAFIDTEGGAAPYRAAYAFDLQPAKTYAEVEALVRWVLAEGQGRYATLVIDSITVPYQMLLDAAQDANGRISHEKRAVVNRQMRALYNLLDQLTVNLYVTARDKKVYEANERKGLDFAGLAPDADEELPHLFDLVFYAMGAAQGGVLKARVTKSRGLDKLDAVLTIDGQTFADRVAPAAQQMGCIVGVAEPAPAPAPPKSANGRGGEPAPVREEPPPPAPAEAAPEPEPPVEPATPPEPHWTTQPSAKHKGKTNWQAIVTAAAKRWTYIEEDLLRCARERFGWVRAPQDIPASMEEFWAALEAWDPTASAAEAEPEPAVELPRQE